MAVALTVSTKFVAIDKFSQKISQMSAATAKFSAKASATMARIATASSNLSSKLFNLKGAFAALVVGAGLKKIYDLGVGTAKIGDEAAKTSRRLGVTAEFLQEFSFAADRAGVSGEETIKSMEKLNKNVGDLKFGTGSLYTILKKNNPQLLNQLKGVNSNEEAFNLITGAINKMPNQLEKASLSQAAFGRSGLKMLTVMEDGVDGINRLREEARKYGGVISNEDAKASEAFIDAQTNMNFALRGLTNTIGTALMPKIQSLMEKITGWIGNNKELVQQKVSEFAIRIGNALMWLANNIGLIINIAKVYIGALITLKVVTMAATVAQWGLKVAQFASNVVMGISAALTNASAIAVGRNTVALIAYRATLIIATYAQKALNFAMKMNPIGLIILGIMALIAVIRNWSKIIDWIKKQWQKFWGPIKLGIEVFLKYWKKAGEWIRKVWDKATGWIRKLWNKAFGFVSFMVQAFIFAWKKAGEWISKIWEKVTGWISDKWHKIWDPLKRVFQSFVGFFKMVGEKIRQIWDNIIEWISEKWKKLWEWIGKIFVGDKIGEVNAKIQHVVELQQQQSPQEQIKTAPLNADAATVQSLNQTINKNTTNTSKVEIVDRTGKANMSKNGSKNVKLTKTVGQ